MPAPLFSDYLVERRLLRRQLSFWRVAAFGVAIIGVLAAGLRLFGTDSPSSYAPHIAKLAISGLITGSPQTLKTIKDIEDSQAAAVLITINSPGGTTSGSERLFDAIRRLSAKKPTVAVVGDLAASGGYVAALGADQIVAQGNSLVGSIGVLFQFPNFSKVLDTIGVSVETVKSSPLKASPNGFEPTTPEARAALASLVEDSYAWFKTLVKQRRAMTDQQLAAVVDGRVFTGRQGVDLRLVDRLGGEREAIDWLEQEKSVHKGLPVRDWKPKDTWSGLGLLGFSARLADSFGFGALSRALAHGAELAEVRLLDGLVSIWQIESTN
jgi:protease-4